MTKVKQKIPEGWSVKKLGEVCDVRDGTHESPKFHSTGFPLITSKNLTAGTINFDNVQYISEIDHVNICKRSNVDDGDILLAMIGTIGNPVLVKKVRDFSIKNVALFKVGNRNNCINNNYLNNCLQYFSSDLNKKSAGGTQKFVGLTFLRNYKICLPPLSEQKKIAEILGTWDEGIEKLSDLIGLKEKQKKALMQKLLTGKTRLAGFSQPWKDVELGELLNYEQPTKYLVDDYIDYQKKLTPVLTANKAFILGATEDTNGIYNKNDCIIFDDFTTEKKYVNFPFKVKSSAIKILTAKKEVNLKFVFEQMSIIQYQLGGHKRYYLSEYQFIAISIPDLDEQKAIAEVLSTADDEINLLKQKLTALKEQKKGLMQQLLTGKVRVIVN